MTILFVLARRRAEQPKHVRPLTVALIVALVTVVWWLTDDFYAFVAGHLTLFTVLPLAIVLLRLTCRMDWDTSTVVGAVFCVPFAIIVIGLGHMADTVAPERDRLTVAHRGMTIEEFAQLTRPSIFKVSSRANEKISGKTKAFFAFVTREKLLKEIGAMAQVQRERASMLQDAGFGDAAGGGPGASIEDVDLSSDMMQVKTHYTKGLKAAQEAASPEAKEDTTPAYMENYAEQQGNVSKDAKTPRASKQPESPGAPPAPEMALLDSLVDPSANDESAGNAATLEAADSTGAAARGDLGDIPPEALAGVIMMNHSDTKRVSMTSGREEIGNAMISSDTPEEEGRVRWATAAGDQAENAFGADAELPRLRKAGTAREWRLAHQELSISGVMRMRGKHVVLIGTDLHSPGDYVTAERSGTAFWWRINNVTADGVSWQCAGLRIDHGSD